MSQKNKSIICWIIGIIIFLILFYLQALTNSRVDIQSDPSWCSGIYCD